MSFPPCSHRRRAALMLLSLSMLLIASTRNRRANAFTAPKMLLNSRSNNGPRVRSFAQGPAGQHACGPPPPLTRAAWSLRPVMSRKASNGSRLTMVPSTHVNSDAARSEWGMNGVNAGIVNFLKGLMVQYYGDRTYARFYALETIARVPYFGYLCVLHLYETLGQWRQAEYLKVHFAESYNELHHLLIMEELGGNLLFRDRWFAQHAAFFYFFIVVALYLASPRNAYNLNQHVEEHAFSTYDKFLSENEDELKVQPAPVIAKQYYGTDKLYVFNGLHNNPEGDTFEERDADRPTITNLFDTFVAVRNDEWEHVKTMKALQEDVPMARSP